MVINRRLRLRYQLPTLGRYHRPKPLHEQELSLVLLKDIVVGLLFFRCFFTSVFASFSHVFSLQATFKAMIGRKRVLEENKIVLPNKPKHFAHELLNFVNKCRNYDYERKLCKPKHFAQELLNSVNKCRNYDHERKLCKPKHFAQELLNS